MVHQSYSTSVINTLGTSIDNFTKQVEEMASDIHKKSNLLYQDLIEPLDLYYKHYHSKNRDILQDCQEIWTTLHKERTQMLFAKEDYYNQMHTLHQC